MALCLVTLEIQLCLLSLEHFGTARSQLCQVPHCSYARGASAINLLFGLHTLPSKHLSSLRHMFSRTFSLQLAPLWHLDRGRITHYLLKSLQWPCLLLYKLSSLLIQWDQIICYYLRVKGYKEIIWWNKWRHRRWLR